MTVAPRRTHSLPPLHRQCSSPQMPHLVQLTNFRTKALCLLRQTFTDCTSHCKEYERQCQPTRPTLGPLSRRCVLTLRDDAPPPHSRRPHNAAAGRSQTRQHGRSCSLSGAQALTAPAGAAGVSSRTHTSPLASLSISSTWCTQTTACKVRQCAGLTIASNYWAQATNAAHAPAKLPQCAGLTLASDCWA